jgi:hypothetical protein
VNGRRALLCLMTSGLLLLAQLHIWGTRGCPMCGASCRCTSQATGAPCSVRSVGCGGEDGGTAIGSAGPLRAVLAAEPGIGPHIVLETVNTTDSRLPNDPERPPLDRPPRASC